jgi:DUF438 domain-containing protein
MKHENKKDLVGKLAGLLIQIHEGKDRQAIQKEANRLISRIRPHDIAHAESRLMENGFSAQKVQHLSAAFVLMGAMEGRKGDIIKQLPESHLLRKVLAEHDLMRCFLADLEEVAKAVAEMDTLSDTSPQFMRLSHILEHLNAMEEHMDRENDVIFPTLKRQGWESLCRSVENEHVYLRMAISDLVKLVIGFRNTSFVVFKNQLASLVRYLCPAMKEHLFHEDHVLFPLAVEIMEDPNLWTKLKTVCDEIDYCGIHL